MKPSYNVIIVGAGPGGLSVAADLHDRGVKDVIVFEKGSVGQAWLDYPADTRLLSESTPTKDDNMISDVKTSEVFPNIPHPNHIMYQKYLAHVVEVKQIRVAENITVTSVMYNPELQQFVLQTRDGQSCTSRMVVWAAGMFSNPNEDMNAEGCYIHYAKMPYLNEISSDEITVVGSANGASGVVLQLARPGRLVTLVTSREFIVEEPIDTLGKQNMKFILDLENSGLVKIVENFRVKRIYRDEKTAQYVLEDGEGKTLSASKKPIICTGFSPNIEPIKELIEEVCQDRETYLALDHNHQSLKTPGLYLAGVVGKLKHDQGFIVQFREFAEAIGQDIASKLTKV